MVAAHAQGQRRAGSAGASRDRAREQISGRPRRPRRHHRADADQAPTARGLGYTGTAEGLRDPETNLAWGVKYLAGAYRAANGDHNRAMRYYASGYYYAAKRQRQDKPLLISPVLASDAAPKSSPRRRRSRSTPTRCRPPSNPAPIARTRVLSRMRTSRGHHPSWTRVSQGRGAPLHAAQRPANAVQFLTPRVDTPAEGLTLELFRGVLR